MAIDLLGPLYLIAIGVVLFAFLGVGIVLVVRATIRQQNYLAKYDFLHGIKDAENDKRLPSRDERIRDENDRTQRGDAP